MTGQRVTNRRTNTCLCKTKEKLLMKKKEKKKPFQTTLVSIAVHAFLFQLMSLHQQENQPRLLLHNGNVKAITALPLSVQKI